MRKIFILFDVPDNQNDKEWLIAGLRKQYPGRVEPVSIKHVLSKMIMLQGGWYRLKAYIIIIHQCIRALIKANRGDVVICWFSTTGKIFNFISRVFGNRPNIISMNWLNPGGPQKGFHYNLARFAATNKRCTIVVNTPSTTELWKKHLKCNGMDIMVVPDVFDDTDSFCPIKNSFEKICFSGGYGNRDWSLLMRVAYRMPDWTFICVAQKNDFESKVSVVPQNVKMHYNIGEKEYYDLMKSSSVVILPIIGNTISGLINIIKAAQYGIICCVSQTDSTLQYFSEENKDLLMQASDEKWIERLNSIGSMTSQEYYHKTECFQSFIQKTYSPANAIQILKSRIDYLIGQ